MNNIFKVNIQTTNLRCLQHSRSVHFLAPRRLSLDFVSLNSPARDIGSGWCQIKEWIPWKKFYVSEFPKGLAFLGGPVKKATLYDVGGMKAGRLPTQRPRRQVCAFQLPCLCICSSSKKPAGEHNHSLWESLHLISSEIWPMLVHARSQ